MGIQDFSGDYVNEKNVSDNQIITIVSDVTAEEVEDANKKMIQNGKIVNAKKTKYSCIVDIGGTTKIYNIGPQTGIRFQVSFGKDSASWIGKKFKVVFEPYTAFGKNLIGFAGYPLKEEKA